jgi:hypothetical protein
MARAGRGVEQVAADSAGSEIRAVGGQSGTQRSRFRRGIDEKADSTEKPIHLL